MSKELTGGKAFDELLGKLVQVPKREADRRLRAERKAKAKRRKSKQ